jgi:DNA polymerase III subunit gamma/tau
MSELVDDPPYQSLYRRFRPTVFGEVRGQDHVVLALRNAVRDGRVAHAYLFSGPRGTGKTSTARILAKALNCTDLRDGEPCGECSSCVEIAKGTSLDVHELDAASNNGVDAMRDLVSRAALGTPGRQKVYIVDEVHMLSTPASNALLKTLEEPPAHVVFVLATTDPQKVLPTIRSRTQHFEFRLLGPETLEELLADVRREAKLEIPDEAVDVAVRRGRGSARDALSVLEQVVASDSVDDDLPELDEVVEGLAERDAERTLVAVAHLSSAGYSPQQLAGDLVDHLRQGFLALVAPDLMAVSDAEHTAVGSQAERVGLASIVRAMEVLGEAQVTMRDAPDPRVTLEVALVRLAHPELDDTSDSVLPRLERLEAMTRDLSGAAPHRGSPAVSGDLNHAASPASPRTPPGGGEPEAPKAPPADTSPPSSTTTRTSSPPNEPAADGGSSPFPTRDELVQAWGDRVITGLRPKAKALFQAGRFVGVDGDEALFGLPNETHRIRCEELRGEVESALTEHFGRRVRLSLVVDSAGTVAETGGRPPPAPPPPPSPAGGRRGPPRSRPAGREAAGPPPTDEGPVDDMSEFDESDIGEVADIDNSAETRVREAFPGAEEVG